MITIKTHEANKLGPENNCFHLCIKKLFFGIKRKDGFVSFFFEYKNAIEISFINKNTYKDLFIDDKDLFRISFL